MRNNYHQLSANQNECYAELLRCLEAIVIEKDLEISHLQTQKDLQAQHQDFQAQLSAEQTAHKHITNTLEVL